MKEGQHYFFCGVGGSGMSPLAQLLAQRNFKVSGSDRAYDQGKTPDRFQCLEDMGIQLFPQDGKALKDGVDKLVVSTAIEDRIPDVKAAKEANVPICKRSDLLAEIFHSGEGIAVGGTSGKSTITAMTGHILQACGKAPTVINGAIMKSPAAVGLGNIIAGSDLYVIEADESDGSIEKYHPHTGVISNITLDHQPLDELKRLFNAFAERCTYVIHNLDCEESRQLSFSTKGLSFSLQHKTADFYADKIKTTPEGIRFSCLGEDIHLKVPGKHNIANALAAAAAASTFDVDPADALHALSDYRGIKRRLETVGTAKGITVIDDFGHNPDKIAASLDALTEHPGRLLMMFQPHGFGPVRFLKDGLIAAFTKGMRENDILAMPEIYYAGGSATRDVSSNDLIQPVTESGKQAYFFDNRDQIREFFLKESRDGDRIVIMGARDDSLSDFAEGILTAL